MDNTRAAVLAMIEAEPTLQHTEVARRLGVSRQRVHQILKGAGKTGRNTGSALGHRAEYQCWHNMIARCVNAEHKQFKDYGGRGIGVCNRWLHSFPAFLSDMGPKPSADLTLERVNNDGHYEPGNCRWDTRAQQRANQRAPNPYRKRSLSSDQARANGSKSNSRGRPKAEFTPEQIEDARKVWESRKVKRWQDAEKLLPKGFTVWRARKMFGLRGRDG